MVENFFVFVKTFKTSYKLMQQKYAFAHVTITKDFIFTHW